MLNSPLALELANALIRERLQLAARQALVNQLPAASRRAVPVRLAAVARVSLASGLRSLAVRLDPTLGCEASLAVPPSR